MSSDAWVATAVCTLPTNEQPLRVAEFDDLFTRCLTDAWRVSASHLRLTLSGPVELTETVQDLADRESACCSFFTFSLSIDNADADASQATRVILDIQVPEVRGDVLDVLATRATNRLTDSHDLSR